MADIKGGGHESTPSKTLPEVDFEELLHQFRTSKLNILSSLKCPAPQPPILDTGAFGKREHADVECRGTYRS